MASPVPRPVLRRQRSPRGPATDCATKSSTPQPELLLDTGGWKAVSIRSVAERWASPTVDLPALRRLTRWLNAVTARYYEQTRRTPAAGPKVGQPTRWTCSSRRACVCPVRHADPRRCTASRPWPRTTASDVDAVLASSAFVHLLGTVRELMNQGIFAEGDPTVIALICGPLPTGLPPS